MSKGTTPRAIRVEAELWEAAKAATKANGETISDVARRALQEYVEQHPSEDKGNVA